MKITIKQLGRSNYGSFRSAGCQQKDDDLSEPRDQSDVSSVHA